MNSIAKAILKAALGKTAQSALTLPMAKRMELAAALAKRRNISGDAAINDVAEVCGAYNDWLRGEIGL